MRKIIIGIAAVGVLALGVPAPAFADTITTSDVAPTGAVDLTTDNFPLAVPTTLLAPGPVSFPLEISVLLSTQSVSGFTVPSAPAGCTRVVNSASAAFEFLSDGSPAITLAAVTKGSTALDAGATITYEGDGALEETSGGGAVTLEASEAPQSGTMTLTYAAPVTPEETLLALGVYIGGELSEFTFTNVTFNVTDTCVVAAVAPAAPAPTLANTGVDVVAPGLASLVLLSGGLFVFFAARRRGRQA